MEYGLRRKTKNKKRKYDIKIIKYHPLSEYPFDSNERKYKEFYTTPLSN